MTKVNPGQATTVTCTARGLPQPSKSEVWLSVTKPGSGTVKVIRSSIGELSYQFLFNIDSVQEQDKIVCESRTSFGDDNYTVTLELYGK